MRPAHTGLAAAETQDLEAHINESILREKIGLIFVNGKSANYTVLVTVPMIAWILQLHYSLQPVLIWAAIISTLCLLRLWLIARFQARAPTEPRSLRRWVLVYTLVTALAGCAWGGMLLLFMPGAEPIAKAFLAILAVGIISASLPALHTYYLAYLAYTLPILAALCLAYFIDSRSGHLEYLALLALTLVYYVLLLNTIRNNLLTLIQALRLRFENERLTQAAEAGSQAKTDFLATISHEMRTPMNGILGMTQLLMNESLTKAQRRLAEAAHQSGESLLASIDSILNFSRMEQGELSLACETFDLPALIARIGSQFQDQAAAKGLDWTIELKPELPRYLRGDPVQLSQLISGLLSNAVKFTARGGIDLRARIRSQDNGQVTLVVEIHDTGPGIPADKQRLVFEPFSQIDSSTRRTHGGSGLGLAIVKRLVDLMGGTINLSTHAEREVHADKARHESEGSKGSNGSNVGQGTRVVVELPFALVTLTDNQPIEARSQPIKTANPLIEAPNPSIETPVQARQPDAELLSGRVLLAEDHSVNQAIILAMLRKLGLDARLVADGQAAVDAASEEPFDLALIDRQMPALDGFEVSALIRAQEAASGSGRRMPIVLITSEVEDELARLCAASGIDDYLPKPLRQAALHKTLRRYLALDRMPTEVPAGISKPAFEQPPTKRPPAPWAKAEPPLIDADAIDALRRLGSVVLREAISDYLRTTPEAMRKIRQAISTDDAETLWTTAHGLKSSSASLGSPRLAELFAKLEASGRGRHQGGDQAAPADQPAPASQPAPVQPAPANALLSAIESTLPLFIATLERIKLDLPDADATQAPASAPELAQTILVVDDEPAFRLTTLAALRQMGYHGLEADGGEAALELARATVPDVIMVDAVMPGMDGFALCEQLRTIESLRDVAIMMVTGLDDLDSIHHAYRAGATSFVAKPLNYALLEYRLQFMLRAARDAAELKASQARLCAAHKIARIGFWQWSSSTRTFELSDQLRELCGLMPMREDTQASCLERYTQLIHPDDRHFFQQGLERTLADQPVTEIYYRLVLDTDTTLHAHQQIEIVATNEQEMTLMGTVQDVTRQKESEAQIVRLAYTDTLTGLGSRAYLYQRLNELLHHAQRYDMRFGLLFLDLDHFKDINDSLGHDIGDELLQLIAKRIQSSLRDTDLATRFGGDEFCIIIDELHEEIDAALTAERLLEAIAAPTELHGRPLRPSASIGLAFYPKDGTNATMLLKAADNAMYAAKRKGKRQIAFFSPELTKQAEARLTIEQELRLAIEHDQLELHYQPQIRLQDRALIGLEALVRWRHPSRGLVYPDGFIALAEQSGLIIPLEQAVLKQACGQLRAWREQGLTNFHVAVNISPPHFASSSLPSSVRACLGDFELTPERLELEITESSMQIPESLIDIFQDIVTLGVPIAIDDFGTGYSSLGSLKTLPVQRLKIDRVFVQDILHDEKSTYFFGSIISLAHALGMEVIAEGVEDQQSLQVLDDLGCDIVQGYYFSRPLPVAEITEKLRASSQGDWPIDQREFTGRAINRRLSTS